jgi:pilus assembly protein CpaB
LTAEKLKIISWPAEIRPEGSFETIAEVLGSERRVVLRSIGRNDPVTKEKISGYGSRASLSQIIKEGHRATSVPISVVRSVSGFILPGDQVDVQLTFTDTAYGPKPITMIIFQDMRVLAIDQLSDEAQGGTVVGRTATLEVTPEQAQKLALAADVGQLSLTLRRMEPTEDEKHLINSRPIYVRDLKPAKAPVVKKEVKKATGNARRVYKPRVVKPKKLNPYGDMKITRGIVESEEEVLVEEIVEKNKANGYPLTPGSGSGS